jgi:hypothetical protein
MGYFFLMNRRQVFEAWEWNVEGVVEETDIL